MPVVCGQLANLARVVLSILPFPLISIVTFLFKLLLRVHYNSIRNSFQSNFEVNPAITRNNPQLSYSNFDLRHRIVATL